ncbi:hypothetical protein [Streptomyces triticirhizae]|uniref:hypothetical protein n=1 Tax=Streptomyces triticirhizae TaxID=2483353 RepID=UPI0013150FE7|nr:hypothetical protein [Streptomyces triticirhizae]
MTRDVSRSRAVPRRRLAALVLAAVVLSGCGGGGGDDEAATSSPPPTSHPDPDTDASPSASPSPSASSSPSPSASEDAAPWAGSEQFAQIEDAWTSDGVNYLSVRPARKEAVTESYEAWLVIPSEGPFTTVPLAEDATVLLSAPLTDEAHPSSHSPTEFVSLLATLPSSTRTHVGYDLSFDGAGRVTTVESLYTP